MSDPEKVGTLAERHGQVTRDQASIESSVNAQSCFRTMWLGD